MNNRSNKTNRGFENNPYIGQNNTGSFSQNNSEQNIQNQTNQNPYYTQSAISQNTQVSQQPSAMDSLFNSFDTQNFLKGALIGAVGAYLLTNENAQKTIFKTVAKAGDMFGAGMEEMKERMEDAKAELEAQNEAKA